MTQTDQQSSSLPVPPLAGEERVEVVYALAETAARYKNLARNIDQYLDWLHDKPLEKIPDGHLITVLKTIPRHESPLITYWKQRLYVPTFP